MCIITDNSLNVRDDSNDAGEQPKHSRVVLTSGSAMQVPSSNTYERSYRFVWKARICFYWKDDSFVSDDEKSVSSSSLSGSVTCWQQDSRSFAFRCKSVGD